MGGTENLPVSLETLKSTTIPFEHLKRIVEECKIIFRTNDILFFLGEFIKCYNMLRFRKQDAIYERETTDIIGLEAGLETPKWIWENELMVVTSDTPSFKRPRMNRSHADPNHILH